MGTSHSRTSLHLHGMDDPTKLCGPCARLDVLGVVTRPASLSGPDEKWPLPQESPWHKTLDAVFKSAASCSFCALVIKGWKEAREVVVGEGMESGDFNPQTPPEDLLFDIMDMKAYSQGTMALEVGHWDADVVDSRQICDAFFLSVKCHTTSSTSWDAHDPLVADFRLTFDPDLVPGPEAHHHLHELPARDSLNPRSIAVANHWLETCVKTHGESCGTSSWGNMPTRVLEISSDTNMIYLRVSSDIEPDDGRYVALSHCWGKTDTPFITTRSNFESRMAGINLDEMPKTFQDAFIIARHLGLRYLWIDSLCIVQQDLEDWQIESAKMATVYRDAYLVLGAAGGLSDASGFLGPRNFKDTIKFQPGHSVPLHLQLLPPKTRRWTFRGRHASDPLAAEPISRRAWCLQERYLPKRSLQYGSQQMFWECEKIRASEDGDAIYQKGDYLKALWHTAITKESVFHREDREAFPEKGRIKWIDWYQMVEDYTSRNITASTDKLPALTGLASAIADKISEGEYMAGLWRSGLIEGLTWCRKAPGQAFGKPDEYVAPSWSWASVQGVVQFPIYNWHLTRAPWKSRMADFEALTQYVSHTADLKDKDMYGRLEGGSLCIKAPLLPVVSIRPRSSKIPGVEYLFGQPPNLSDVADKVVELQLAQGQRILIDGGFDFPIDENHLDLAVVFLTRLPHLFEDGFVEHRFGLLVEKLDNGSYRRVGFVDGSLLETHRSALLTWKEYLPRHWRQKGKHESEEELNKSITKSLTELDEMKSDHVKSGTMDELEVLGYPRQGDGDDMYDAEPPNILAPNPLDLEDVELTLV
ncbi:hypothetical protein G7Z17_g9342 [Cylindrodendrum hubeiense]|uniref:Heterokaryon incompatibility domain-containing protein n=1 Tax=Cylindrodendrum hubeiense TaxID=595255 RepID=A0A9P5H830_9HYPO|nr:hypothetical protein G7Z17_g9342 [Cylindrodendrum hubeiense]